MLVQGSVRFGYSPNSKTNTLETWKNQNMLIRMIRNLHTSSDSSRSQKVKQSLFLLNQCSNLKQFNKIHAHIITCGLHQNRFLVGKMIETSAIKLSINMSHSWQIFTQTQNPNQFAWNIIIRGFSIRQTPEKALMVFILMLREGVEPESFTFAFVLKACSRFQAIKHGKIVHGLVLKNGFESHVFVGNTLIHMYASCGKLSFAGQVFDEMPTKNVVAWNAMIAGYAQNGLADKALQLFSSMEISDMKPDDVTMVSVLSACAQNKGLDFGRCVHNYLIKNSWISEWNVNLGTALIDMYAKCGRVDSAKQVFDGMPKGDIGTWNSLIGGYVFNGFFNEALKLFAILQESELKPDEATFVSSLIACGYLGALDLGKAIHYWLEENCFSLNTTLGTVLVEMYSKCGCIEKASQVFDKMPERDVMTWTAMIRGLAVHGHAKDALKLFSAMQSSGIRPDGITFVGVLSACTHAGLVEKGLRYFDSMRHKYGISPTIEHYGCIIDLLGRAGQLEKAFEFVQSMDIPPNAIIWTSLLSACRLHANLELAEIALRNLLELMSDQSGDYVLLSNIYASKGRWEDVEKIRKEMEEGGIKKIPGLSLIEAKQQVKKWISH